MPSRWMYVLLLAAGCAFDATGSGQAEAADATIENMLPDADPDSPDGGAIDDLADAATGCVDVDDDGFYTAVLPGAMCGPADCDDNNDLVYPGQTGAFTTPKNSGDFDYNCDGVEDKLSDTTLGGGCHANVFGPCEGTGWLGAVPDCGEAGIWHRCESSVFSCDESERVDGIMPCV